MTWTQTSKYCLRSTEGYLVSKYTMQHGSTYVARSPAGKILCSSTDLKVAKAACECRP